MCNVDLEDGTVLRSFLAVTGSEDGMFVALKNCYGTRTHNLPVTRKSQSNEPSNSNVLT